MNDLDYDIDVIWYLHGTGQTAQLEEKMKEFEQDHGLELSWSTLLIVEKMIAACEEVKA